MKIVFLTPGTGSYYCGACMRDNALAKELQRRGHEVTIGPMYLPLKLDEEALEGSSRTPIFFGGINIYLQQKTKFFRKTPAFVDRLLNWGPLLRLAARTSHLTSSDEHGAMTYEMLNVKDSYYQKEWHKLLEWLEVGEKPDMICLSTALLSGFTIELRKRLRVPVVTFFQGEDSFLDNLPGTYGPRCWAILRGQMATTNLLIAPSRFYAAYMRNRLGPSLFQIHTVHNGVSLEGLDPPDAEPAVPTIGYLARMSRDKGIEVFVDAFMYLVKELGDTTTRLRIAGAVTAADGELLHILKYQLRARGLASRVDWMPNVTREQKIEVLRSLTIFSVPATYVEAFGLYVVEAMACGVPVVQPQSSAFPEIIAKGGGGMCVPPKDAPALARAWQALLADHPRRQQMRREARLSVEKNFSAQSMCDQFIRAIDRMKAVSGEPAGYHPAPPT